MSAGIADYQTSGAKAPYQREGGPALSEKAPYHMEGFLQGIRNTILFLAFFLISNIGFAEQRFPPPDFEGGHQLPITKVPAARAWLLQYMDVAVLAAGLGIATWLIYKKRSRKGVLALSIFSLLYFGFWRKGCVCSIGSLQNIALALADKSYAVPLGVTAFFVLPLVFSLFAGRTFCAAVCPHGALQDLVLLKPLKVPPWLEQGLGVLPYIYLGAGVLFAATGSAFVICQYDPFVPIFRMSGRTFMVVAGVALLVLGIFVGRPYCRFLCPYGALLRLGGIVSKFRVRVTPDFCTQCKLCESSCPFAALQVPTVGATAPQLSSPERRRFTWLILAAPLLLAGCGWLGWRLSNPASRLHPTVNLAERWHREQVATKAGTAPLSVNDTAAAAAQSAEQLSLARANDSPRPLLAQAAVIRGRFELGGVLFGVWVGVVILVKFVSLFIRRVRTDYEPNRGACLACARCFESCPNELARRGMGVAAEVGK